MKTTIIETDTAFIVLKTHVIIINSNIFDIQETAMARSEWLMTQSLYVYTYTYVITEKQRATIMSMRILFFCHEVWNSLPTFINRRMQFIIRRFKLQH